MKKIPKFDLIKEVENFFDISPYMGIIEFASKYIDFSDDVSSERTSIDWEMYPYQIEILRAFEDLTNIKTVVVAAPEQCRLRA